MKNIQKSTKKGNIIFAILGIALLGLTIYLYINTRDFIHTAESTTGIVVDLQYDSSGDSDVYYPIVSFVDDQGKEIDFRGSSGSNPPSYQVGQEVSILYSPDDSHDAKINSFFLCGFYT